MENVGLELRKSRKSEIKHNLNVTQHEGPHLWSLYSRVCGPWGHLVALSVELEMMDQRLHGRLRGTEGKHKQSYIPEASFCFLR